MLYKALGFVVWRAAKWYLRRRLPRPARALFLGGMLAVVATLVAVGTKRD